MSLVSNLNVLLNQSFVHLAGSEEAAKSIVENYKSEYEEIKKSSITKKVKKGIEYWVVSVTVNHIIEKDAFEAYFGE